MSRTEKSKVCDLLFLGTQHVSCQQIDHLRDFPFSTVKVVNISEIVQIAVGSNTIEILWISISLPFPTSKVIDNSCIVQTAIGSHAVESLGVGVGFSFPLFMFMYLGTSWGFNFLNIASIIVNRSK